MVEDEIEEQAQLLRRFSQEAGLSNREEWDEISERRRHQWRSIARAMREGGFAVLPRQTPEEITNHAPGSVRGWED